MRSLLFNNFLSGLILLLVMWSGITSFASTTAGDHFPTNTLALLSLPRAGSIDQDTAGVAYRKLWQEAAMRPFRERFEATFHKEVSTAFSNNWGVSPAELLRVAGGSATVGIIEPVAGGTNGLLPWLVQVDAGDRHEAMLQLLSRVQNQLRQSGRLITNAMLGTNQFFAFWLKTNSMSADTPEGLAGRMAVVHQSGSTLLVGNSPQLLLETLGRMRDPTIPSLARTQVFRDDRNAFSPGSTALAWINAQLLNQLVSRRYTNQLSGRTNEFLKGALPSWEKASKTLGFSALRSAVLTAQPGTNGLELRLFLRIPENERTGLLQIIQPEPLDTTPPAFVSSGVSRFTRYRLNGIRAWSGLEKTLTSLSPELGSVLQLLTDTLGRDSDSTYDFRKQAIASLGNDLLIWQRPLNPTNLAEWKSTPTFVLIGSTNSTALLTGLKSFFSIAPNAGDSKALRSRQILDQQVWSYDWPDFGSTSSPPRTLLATAVPGYLAVTFHEPLLLEFLRLRNSPASPLREARGLPAAIEAAGGGSTGFLTVNHQTESVGPLWNLLRTQPSSVSAAWARPLLPFDFTAGIQEVPAEAWFDLKLLPPFESVARHFSVTVAVGEINRDGILFRWITPNSESR